MYKENYKDKGLLKTGSSGGEGVFSEKIGGFLENQGFSGKKGGGMFGNWGFNRKMRVFRDLWWKIEVLVEKSGFF